MKIGVFIPRLPTKMRRVTTLDFMASYKNVFVCVPNGMQRLEDYPPGVTVLPIGGDIVTARNNILAYAQQHKYDAIWVIDDDLDRFVSVINGRFVNTKFKPYLMNCRVGAVSTPLFMKDNYERNAAVGKVKRGLANGMIYFEDFTVRYRDRDIYGHEDCDLYLRLASEGYEPIVDTTHFRSFPNNAKLSLTNSNNPKYDWLIYREWGDLVKFNQYMSSMRADKKYLNKPKTWTKYPTDIEEFFRLWVSKNKRKYDVDKLLAKLPDNIKKINMQ